MSEAPLSTVRDTNGHTIQRFPNNRLVITGTAPITRTDAIKVAAWFWSKVAQRHTPTTPNDPQQGKE